MDPQGKYKITRRQNQVFWGRGLSMEDRKLNPGNEKSKLRDESITKLAQKVVFAL